MKKSTMVLLGAAGVFLASGDAFAVVIMLTIHSLL